MKMNNLLPEIKIYRLKNNVYYIFKEDFVVKTDEGKMIIKGDYKDYLKIYSYVKIILKTTQEFSYNTLLQTYILQSMLNNGIIQLKDYRRYLQYPFLHYGILQKHNTLVTRICSYKLLCYL